MFVGEVFCDFGWVLHRFGSGHFGVARKSIMKISKTKILKQLFFKKIAEMKKCFWTRFFSTVWTKSLDSSKTVQSTRGSSSMPRPGIAFRGCL